jgi:hypothetical protein
MLPTEIIFRLDDHDSAVAMISESFPHMVEVDSVNLCLIISENPLGKPISMVISLW